MGGCVNLAVELDQISVEVASKHVQPAGHVERASVVLREGTAADREVRHCFADALARALDGKANPPMVFSGKTDVFARDVVEMLAGLVTQDDTAGLKGIARNP